MKIDEVEIGDQQSNISGELILLRQMWTEDDVFKRLILELCFLDLHPLFIWKPNELYQADISVELNSLRGFDLFFPMGMQKGSKKLEYLLFLLVDNTESCLWAIHDWVEEPYK